MPSVTGAPSLTDRDRAILRAVAAGRVVMSGGCTPDLFVDGLCFSDQQAAHSLVHRGFIASTAKPRPGSLVPARLTTVGASVLAGVEQAVV